MSDDLALARRLKPLILIGNGARAYRATDQTITTATATAISFSGVRWDDGPYWAGGSPTRLTFPAPGRYVVGFSLRFAAIGTGYRQGYALLDGATILAIATDGNPTAAVDTDLHAETVHEVSASSYVELFVYQNRGANLNVTSAAAFSPEMWAYRI